jgi:hypothetical protein
VVEIAGSVHTDFILIHKEEMPIYLMMGNVLSYAYRDQYGRVHCTTGPGLNIQVPPLPKEGRFFLEGVMYYNKAAWLSAIQRRKIGIGTDGRDVDKDAEKGKERNQEG